MRALFSKQDGFTIPELITVIVVLGILTGLVFTTLDSFYSANTTTLGQTTQDTDTRGVLHDISNMATNSPAFGASLTVSAPQGSTNNGSNLTWSYKGSSETSRVLMVQNVATDKALTDTSRLPALQDTGSGCGIDTASTVPYYSIYFVGNDPQNSSQKNLYRRTVVAPSGTLCGTVYQKNTCASAVIASYSSVCKGSDAVLLYNVTSFAVDYYTSANDTGPLTDQYSTTVDKSAAIAAAKAAVVTVATNRTINGKSSTSTASIRISRSY